MRRLPIVLSLTALVVAVMGFTSVGQATRDALPFARNADRVDLIHASRTPKAGYLYPLGTNGKFPGRVLTVTKGDRGPVGPPGATGAQGPQGATGPEGPAGATNVKVYTAEQYVPSLLTAWVSIICPSGQRATGGGGRAVPGVLIHETLPTNASGAPLPSGQTPVGWRVGVENYNDQPATILVYVVCAAP